ncbi:hypothetical protein Nmel_017675 [Mimus melanotis]
MICSLPSRAVQAWQGFFSTMAIGKSQILGCGVLDLGISVCYKVLEQREGQHVVSLGLSEGCELCVCQTEERWLGSQRKKGFLLKSCRAAPAPLLWLRARGSELGHHSTQDMQTLTWGGSTERFKSLR